MKKIITIRCNLCNGRKIIRDGAMMYPCKKCKATGNVTACSHGDNHTGDVHVCEHCMGIGQIWGLEEEQAKKEIKVIILENDTKEEVEQKTLKAIEKSAIFKRRGRPKVAK